MGKIFSLALLAMIVYFSVKSMFKPIDRPAKEPEFKKGDSEPATEMTQDPECGVYVDPLKALSLENKGVVHYFCSEECRNKYFAKIERGEIQ